MWYARHAGDRAKINSKYKSRRQLEEFESAVSFEIGIDDPVSNGTEKGSESFSVRGVSRRDSLAKYAAAFF
jgi:hypothetical protein